MASHNLTTRYERLEDYMQKEGIVWRGKEEELVELVHRFAKSCHSDFRDEFTAFYTEPDLGSRPVQFYNSVMMARRAFISMLKMADQFPDTVTLMVERQGENHG